jgi:hypothetical protein
MPKKPKPLVDKGEPSQTTERGLEIPVPERGEVFGLLDKAAKKRDQKPSARGKGKRRTSRGR